MNKFCLLIAVLLLLSVPLPVQAENNKYSFTNAQGDIISITLSDANNDGIQFGIRAPSDTEIYGDAAQSDGVPGITITIEADTNTRVDINIRGESNSALALENWKYSTDYYQNDITSLTSDYPAIPIHNEAPAGAYAFYQWISVPLSTEAGTYTTTVWFKVEDD